MALTHCMDNECECCTSSPHCGNCVYKQKVMVVNLDKAHSASPKVVTALKKRLMMLNLNMVVMAVLRAAKVTGATVIGN